MKFDHLIERFRGRPLFELREVLAQSDNSAKSLKNQLSGWTQDGKLTRLRRGVYLLEEPYRNQMPSVYYVSNCLLRPSYVSLQTAPRDNSGGGGCCSGRHAEARTGVGDGPGHVRLPFDQTGAFLGVRSV